MSPDTTGADAAVDTLSALAAVLNARVLKHERATGMLATAMARELCLDEQTVSQTELAAHIHDIGLNGIDVRIIDGAHRLSEREHDILRLHSERGETIVANIPSLRSLGPAIRSHHERFDGSGYPDGLRAEEIPIESRVIAVADAYICMTNQQFWRPLVTAAVAIRELVHGAGAQFDEEVVEALLQHLANAESDGMVERAPVRGMTLAK